MGPASLPGEATPCQDHTALEKINALQENKTEESLRKIIASLQKIKNEGLLAAGLVKTERLSFVVIYT